MSALTRHARAGVAGLLAGLVTCAGALADQSDPRLEELFRRLQAADAGQAHEAEAGIWKLWLESGNDQVDKAVRSGVVAMNRGEFDAAIGHFNRVVQMAPRFAEGWNKRATVRFLRGEFAASVEDIRRTLALEPRHFGAISGLGLIFMQRRDREGALAAFERVLAIHPHAPGARENIEMLRRVAPGLGV